jgi:predicted RNA-binding Zn-ribbon protein involved in translation (DUF1610 family)
LAAHHREITGDDEPMVCSICGETLDSGAVTCPVCGTGVSRPAARLSTVRSCPSCGYQGQGVPYFTRTGHIALLVGVSFFTSGIGGFVYWLARRHHRICPSCGLAWHYASNALPRGAGEVPARLASDAEAPVRLPSGGRKRRALGFLIIAMGIAMVVGGIAGTEIGLLFAGSIVAGVGTGFFAWGAKGLQRRRTALMEALQQRVLRLATRSGGTLTVTQVAAELNLSITAAESVLMAMDDGYHVRSDITEDGVMLYEFPEVRHRPRLEPGSP